MKPTKKVTDLKNYMLPNSMELEQAVLGAILLNRDAIITASAILQSEMFYNPKHQMVYGAMMGLYEKSSPIDIETIVQQLMHDGNLESVTAFYIVELTNKVASAANLEYHARIIVQKWIRRQYIVDAYETIQEAADETIDCFDVMDNAELRIDSVKQKTTKNVSHSRHQQVKSLLNSIEKVKESGGNMIGKALFGIPNLDNALDGGEEDDLIIIAGRPGMGKSSLFNSAAVHAVRTGEPFLIWSAEMSETNQVGRLIAALADIDYNRMRKGDLSELENAAMYQAIDEYESSNLIIRDDAGVNVVQFRSEIITLKRKYNLSAVFFDRIEKFAQVGNEDERSKLSFATGLLKRTAQEIGMPIIVAMQLNREVEKTVDKKPELHHLQNSGAAEQDATKVAFCYRPEYYGFTELDDETPTDGVAQVIIAKNRNKQTATVTCGFNKKAMVYTGFIEAHHIYDNSITPSVSPDFSDDSKYDTPF